MRNNTYTTISRKGRAIKVPSLCIGERTVIAPGRWLKIAAVQDEAWLAGDVVDDPEFYIAKIRYEKLSADIFTFTQKLPNTAPHYRYPMEWNNVAAIPTTDYTYWWEQRVSQVVRKNVRRAVKRGLNIREVPFSDALIAGIVEINNETPIRQKKLFWHYGKSFSEVKKDYSTFLDCSEYIGAFYENELVGFIKMVYMGDIAGILQLLCKGQHYDKRPANALLARAVEICHMKGLKFLTYGQYVYGDQNDSPLTEFKRRNGFEPILLPRYYIPLTLKGKVALQAGLHHGMKQLLPKSAWYVAVKLRSLWYEKALLQSAKKIE